MKTEPLTEKEQAHFQDLINRAGNVQHPDSLINMLGGWFRGAATRDISELDHPTREFARALEKLLPVNQ